MDRDLLLALGELIASHHVPRSIPGGLHPTTQAAYDKIRSQIRDVGWSTPEEIAERLERALEPKEEEEVGR